MHKLLASSLYFSLQFFRKEPVAEILKKVRETEFVSQEELHRIQANRLFSLLRYAVNHVPYYKSKYKKFENDIKYLNTWYEANQLIDSIPRLDPDYVRSHKAIFFSDEINHIKTYPDRTSGSSGTPLVFPCDQVAWAYRHALFFRCAESFDIEVGEPSAYFYGLHWRNRTKKALAVRDFLLNRVRVSAYDISNETFDWHLRKLRQHKPTHFIGYPSAVYDFCFLALEKSVNLMALKLKAVFLTSEPLLDYQKELIENITGAPCVNYYGSAEGGFNAFSCPDKKLHLATESTWMVRKANNRVLVTDLFLRAFPLINYDIGDEIIFEDSSTCTCGRNHPVIKEIIGRSGEPIRLPNGRTISSHLPGYIFKPLSDLGAIRKFRFVLSKDQKLYLYLVVTDTFKVEYERVLISEIKKAFGDDNKFQIEYVDSLPVLPNAKHRSFVVE